MTISFSGLASGLDTSSWIQSLTALKQAKVTVLEEKRENVIVSRDTLSSIKSFFATFRSTIEKITDTRFNIATMDLFAQNIATSANLEKLTATATHKAIEGKYDIKVDQIATGTKAISGHRYTQTITEHNIAQDDSLLSTIGVNEGRILVNVGETGVQKQLRIEEGETIDSFIAKLEALGGDIDAQYDKENGVFRVNLSASDIIDLDGTNIIGALHLTGVNEGYTSDQLQVEQTQEVFDAAVGTTKFSDLGVSAGTITIQANEFEYDFTVDGNTTLQEFITALEGEDIEASLENGVFTIKNAIITDDGTTGLKAAFGLVETISEKAQQSGQLSYATTVVETTYATLETKLADLGMGTAIVNGDTVVVKNSNDETVTINLSADSTIQDLFDGLEGAGLSAKLNHDGSVEIMGGVITDAGSFDVIDALKLNTDPYTGLATGNALTETIIEYELVTLQTRLHEDLMVKEGFLEVTDSEGRIRYLEINAGDTISNLITELAQMGIYANLDESTGILEITGGSFRTMTNAEVQDAAAAGHEDLQGAVAPLQATDLLELLYGAPAITAEQTEVASTYARTSVLTQAVVNDIIANENTTMLDLGVDTEQAILLKDSTGTILTINVNQDTTLGSIIDDINATGKVSAELVDGVLKLQGGYLENSVVEEALGLEREVTGISHVLGSYMTVSNVAADRNTKFSDLGLGDSVVSVRVDDGVEVGTITTTADMTIGDFFDALAGYGISASISDGVITLSSDTLKYITGGVADDLGIGTVEATYVTTAGVTNTSTEVVKKTYVVTAGYDTTLGELGYGDSTITIYGDDNVELGTLATNADMTIGDLLTGLASYGINGSIEDGVLTLNSDNGHYATGGVLASMGVGTTSSNYYTTTGVVNTSSSAVLHNYTDVADMDSLISNFATVGDVTILDQKGATIGTVSTSGKTFEELFADLSEYGVQGTISDGVITITSNNGNYVTGLENLGIDAITETTTVTTTTGEVMTGSAQTHSITIYASMDAKVHDFSSGVTSITVKDKYGNDIGTVNVGSNTTFADMFAALDNYGIQGTVSDGIVTITSNNGSYVTGMEAMGVDAITTTTTITDTIGTSLSSSYEDYSVTRYYTDLVDLTRTFVTTATITVTDPIIGTSTYTISDTFTVTDAVIGTETFTVEDTFTVIDATIGSETITIWDEYTYDDVVLGTETITVTDSFVVTEPVIGTQTIEILHSHECVEVEIGSTTKEVTTWSTKTITETGLLSVATTFTRTVEMEYTMETVIDGNTVTISEPRSTVIEHTTWTTYTGIVSQSRVVEELTSSVTVPVITYKTVTHSNTTTTVIENTSTAPRTITVTDTFTVQTITTQTATGTVSFTTTVEKTSTDNREITVTDTFTVEKTTTVSREVTVYDTITIESTSTVPREITVYGTFEITTTTYEISSTTSTYDMAGDTRLSQLGYSSTSVSGYCNGEAFSLSFDGSNTVTDIIAALAAYGITGVVTDGVLTLEGTNYGYITSSSGLISGSAYTTQSYSYTTGFNTTSDLQSYGTTTAASSETTFAQLGASSGINVKVMDNGTEYTIAMNGNNSVGDLLTALAAHGISGSIVNGVLTVQGKEGNYFTDIGGLSEFGITTNNTSTDTYLATLGVNTTSDYHSRTYDVSMTSSSTFAEIGATGSVTVYSDGKEYTVNVNSENTVGDLMTALAGLGISTSIQNGKLTLEGDNEAYITSIDSTLQTALKLSATNYTTTEHTTTDNTASNEQNYNTTDTLTTQSTFESLGMTADGSVTVVSDGIEYTINVQKEDTVDDLISTLAGHGITAYVIDGKITFQGDNEAFIKEISTNVNTALKLGTTNYSTTEHTTTKNDESDKQTYTTEMTDKTTLKDLGISTGTVNLYQNGNVYSIAVNENMTIGEFREILANYGVDSAVTDGKISLTDNGIVWLSNGTSNLASKLGIEYDDWTIGEYSQESDVLGDTEDDYDTVSGDTKLVDLQDEDGNSLGITTGEYIVYQNGVRTTETITEETTVQDFISTMSTYAMAAKLTTDGQLVVGANHDTYLATSGATGVATTNAIDILFEEWNFVNIYTSNNLEQPQDVVVAMSENTKLSDINEGAYQEGIISVVKDGVVTNITLAADDTVGTLMNELAMYGFDSTINDAGQLIIKSKNNSKLQNYNGTGASNALDLLGISDDTWIMTKVYTGDPVEVSQEVTSDTAITRDVLLSELGITTGEYYIYNNGNRETALISSDETLGSFLDTLALAGIQASIINNGDHSILELTGSGDSYVTSSTSVNNRSNVIDVLFPSANDVTNYDYQGELKTSRIVTTYTNATEDTLLSEVFTAWTDPTAKAEGVLSVVVDGVENNINITATESVGSLLGKLNAVGVDAAIVNGEIIIQSGYSLFEIDTTKTTSNIVNDFGLAYHDDLGGYAASSADVISTTTRTEDIVESAAKWADYDTQLSLLNISSGYLAVYKNGEKANILIDSNETFGQLRTKIANAHEGVDIKFENGYLVFYSTQGDAVEVGSTTDTSNIAAICGLSNDKSGEVRSARELYKANGISKLTTADIFRKGDVTEGTFVVGNATITIDADTTLNDIISQINASADANATANWDSADGKLVIKSRVTGSSMINIEAGTSNFTDIMGLTTTERNPDDTVISTKIDVTAQEIGQNSMFSINGTYYTSTSNTITSDLTRIEGVTINLKDVTEGETVTLTIEKDKETVANAVSDIVDAYNELITNVDEVVARDGQLSDQSTLRFIRNQIRSLMTSSLAGVSVFKNLDSIGITSEAASGANISTENINTLYFDKDKFLKAFDADIDAVKSLLVGTDTNLGVFTKVENVVETALTGATGYFQSADRSYMNEITKLNEKIRKAQNDVEVYRARLEAKFSAMDQLIANIQNQYSSFLG